MDSQRLNNIKNIVANSGRAIEVVAVTKTWPFETVLSAYGAGFRHFGENRVEEGSLKIEKLKNKNLEDIVWHMIGHVQARRAREVAAAFDWVDSVDSITVAGKLNDSASALHKKLSVLLEVNLSGEASKYGFDMANWSHDSKKIDDFFGSVREILGLASLSVAGLMTMPPYVADAEKNRALFKDMKILLETICNKYPSFGRQLSMGTSCDYNVAIEEGATMVRLGEALFGPRKLNNE
jgi:PLP dependent protein